MYSNMISDVVDRTNYPVDSFSCSPRHSTDSRCQIFWTMCNLCQSSTSATIKYRICQHWHWKLYIKLSNCIYKFIEMVKRHYEFYGPVISMKNNTIIFIFKNLIEYHNIIIITSVSVRQNMATTNTRDCALCDKWKFGSGKTWSNWIDK